MRKIKIDSNLIHDVDEFYTNLFNTRNFIKPKENLVNLLLYDLFINEKERDYVKLLYDNYDTIVRLRYSEFTFWMTMFDEKIQHKNITKEFSEKIVKELLYQELREKEYLIFVQNRGLKTCVYCNASLAVIVNVSYYKGKRSSVVSERKATFELDHFIPKSSYPFLATSFFNLLPCCPICNKLKLKGKSIFYLYTEDDDLEVIKFNLDKKSEQKYWLTNKREDIVIDYECIGSMIGNKKDFDDMFHIKGLYETQKDIVEELIHKRKAYSNAYKKKLVESFGDVFQDKAMIDRLIVGNYDKPEDIHKRPMAKFTQDIARELGLLPKL